MSTEAPKFVRPKRVVPTDGGSSKAVVPDASLRAFRSIWLSKSPVYRHTLSVLQDKAKSHEIEKFGLVITRRFKSDFNFCQGTEQQWKAFFTEVNSRTPIDKEDWRTFKNDYLTRKDDGEDAVPNLLSLKIPSLSYPVKDMLPNICGVCGERSRQDGSVLLLCKFCANAKFHLDCKSSCPTCGMSMTGDGVNLRKKRPRVPKPESAQRKPRAPRVPSQGKSDRIPRRPATKQTGTETTAAGSKEVMHKPRRTSSKDPIQFDPTARTLRNRSTPSAASMVTITATSGPADPGNKRRRSSGVDSSRSSAPEQNGKSDDGSDTEGTDEEAVFSTGNQAKRLKIGEDDGDDDGDDQEDNNGDGGGSDEGAADSVDSLPNGVGHEQEEGRKDGTGEDKDAMDVDRPDDRQDEKAEAINPSSPVPPSATATATTSTDTSAQLDSATDPETTTVSTSTRVTPTRAPKEDKVPTDAMHVDASPLGANATITQGEIEPRVLAPVPLMGIVPVHDVYNNDVDPGPGVGPDVPRHESLTPMGELAAAAAAATANLVVGGGTGNASLGGVS